MHAGSAFHAEGASHIADQDQRRSGQKREEGHGNVCRALPIDF
jgi:hypothetical protein